MQDEAKVSKLFNHDQSFEGESELSDLTEKQKAERKVVKMLKNSAKNYRKKTRDKKYDPMDLKNRI